MLLILLFISFFFEVQPSLIRKCIERLLVILVFVFVPTSDTKVTEYCFFIDFLMLLLLHKPSNASGTFRASP